MSVELYLVRVLSPQLFASLMPITHPQFTPHPEHLKHLEDLEDLEQLEQLEHLKHFEDLEDIPSDNSLTPPDTPAVRPRGQEECAPRSKKRYQANDMS